MKLRSAILPLLVVSVCGNVFLAIAIPRIGTQAGASVLAPPGSPALAPGASSRSTTAPLSGEVLRDVLQRRGYSRAATIAAVQAHLGEKRLRFEREARLRNARSSKWWETGSTSSFLTTLELDEVNRLRDAEESELQTLFGSRGLVTQDQLANYSFLPEEKAAQIASLRVRLDDRMALVKESHSSPDTPAARQAIRTAFEEMRAAARECLSVSDYALWERASAPHSVALAEHLPYFSGSEKDYELLYDIFRRNANAFTDGASSPSALVKELSTQLSPETFKQWQFSQRPEHRGAVELKDVFGVSESTYHSLASIPRALSERSAAIMADSTLSVTERSQRLAELGRATRQEIKQLIGHDLYSVYAKATERDWLSIVEMGASYVIRDNGSVEFQILPSQRSGGPR